MDTIEKVQERLNPELELEGILATMYDSRTVHGREVLARVVEAFGDRVFHTVITRTVRFPETTVAGEPITTYASSSPARRPTAARQGGARPMSRRASVPGAAELFRATGRGTTSTTRPSRAATAPCAPYPTCRRRRRRSAPCASRPRDPSAAHGRAADHAAARPQRRPPTSGRSGTRRRSPSTSPPTSCSTSNRPGWSCAATHGLAVDRGRIVREAVAAGASPTSDAKGASSILVRRLRQG